MTASAWGPRRALHALLLAFFAGLQVLGVWLATHPFYHGPLPLPEALAKLVVWKMFAPDDRTNWRVDFEGSDGEAWVPLPMEEWVPRTPDNTLPWERSLILIRPSFRDPFVEEACARSGRERVRAVWRSWPKVPGEQVDAAPLTREKVLVTRSCTR